MRIMCRDQVRVFELIKEIKGIDGKWERLRFKRWWECPWLNYTQIGDWKI